jgi:mannose-6-phosphate isomerase-like protein (cupin superfamily)
MTASEITRGIHRHRAEYSWFDPFPGERVALHVTGKETDGKFACGEALLEPGAGQPLHIHHNIDELLYVLAGQIDFSIQGRRFRTGPGGFVFVPQGSIHAFRNLSDTQARMLGIFSPPHLDGMFEAMLGQPLDAFPAIAAEFATEILGPLIEPETEAANQPKV